MSSDKTCTAKIEDFSIKNSTEEKLLGVKFDSNLSFENHVTSLCKRTSLPKETFYYISVSLLPSNMDVSQS